MPTVIDSLLVTLGLDASQFNAQQRKAVQNLRGVETQAGRTAEKLRTKGNVGAEFFSALTRGALALGAVLGGAEFLKGFVSNTMDSVAATGRLAHDIGTTTEKLTTFTGAVWQFAGGTKEGAAQSIAGLNAAVTNMQMGGNPALIQFFNNLGVSVTDAQGHMRDTLDVLNDIGKSAYWKSLTPQQQTFYGQSLGLDKSTIDFLRKSDSERESAYSKVRAEGVPSDADAAAMQKFQDALRGIEAEFDTFGRNLTVEFGPDLIAAAKSFLQSAKGMEGYIGDIKTFFAKDPKDVWQGDMLTGTGSFRAWMNKFFGPDVKPTGFNNSPAGKVWGVVGDVANGLNKLHGQIFGNDGKAVMSDLVAQGVDPNRAAAMAANAAAESSGNPTAVSPDGGAVGLYQWRGDRVNRIEDHFHKRILDMSMSEQNAAMLWELSNKESATQDALRPGMSIGDTAETFDRSFERNENDYRDIQKRRAEATRLLTSYQDGLQKNPHAAALGSSLGAAARLRGQAKFHSLLDSALSPSAASVLARLRATTVDPALRPTAATVAPQRTGNTDNSSQTTIGQITVKTAATDADGIAGSIRQAMARYPIVPQANTGLA